jgi:hypothetical protein
MKISVKLLKDKKEFIANCPELDINCYGENKDEAINRIKKVIYFYINSAKELGLNVNEFNEITIEGRHNSFHVDSLSPLTSSKIN